MTAEKVSLSPLSAVFLTLWRHSYRELLEISVGASVKTSVHFQSVLYENGITTFSNHFFYCRRWHILTPPRSHDKKHSLHIYDHPPLCSPLTSCIWTVNHTQMLTHFHTAVSPVIDQEPLIVSFIWMQLWHIIVTVFLPWCCSRRIRMWTGYEKD